jgi:hypothetical protein
LKASILLLVLILVAVVAAGLLPAGFSEGGFVLHY